jgi:hypothetical protein
VTAVVTSRIIVDDRKPGLSGLVIAEHVITDDADPTVREVWPAVFEALAGESAQTRLNAMVAQRLADRSQAEIARNIFDVVSRGSLATPRLKASTAAQNFAALRIEYQTASQLTAIMIGDFLSTLTDAQLQTAFGISAGQVTTLRTNKLTPAASAAATIRAAAGQ